MSDDTEDQIIEDVEEEVSLEWLFTFADMIMLMFATFVLLFAMSAPDTKKMSSALNSVAAALGQKDGRLLAGVSQEQAGAILDQVLLNKQIFMAQQKVFSDLQAMQEQKGMAGLLWASFDDGVITLRAQGDVLFGPGDVALTEKGRAVVEGLKDFFVQHPDQTINIRGFTDSNPPPAGSRFKDNWELSSMRAVNVLRVLMQVGIEPKRLTATGLADMNPLFPNTSDEYRAQNRRVEFVLEKRVTGK